jgi:hypothetical protein
MNVRRTTQWLAAGLSMACITTVAKAQLIDLTTGNGGFTTQNLVSSNSWTWAAGQGWLANGTVTAARSRLLTPTLTTTQTNVSVVATHRFKYERSTITGNCFDGGALFQSRNGGAFDQILSNDLTGVRYTAPISEFFENPLSGSSAFCGESAGYSDGQFVTTTFSGTGLPLGTRLQFALDSAWDFGFAEPDPNWQLVSLELRGLSAPTVVIPEPSTYALVATGLLVMGVVSRRRRA